MDQYGSSFEWRHADNKEQKGYSAWSPFKQDSDYFGNSGQQYMINFRVELWEAHDEQYAECSNQMMNGEAF